MTSLLRCSMTIRSAGMTNELAMRRSRDIEREARSHLSAASGHLRAGSGQE
jgi:hypothetical protein